MKERIVVICTIMVLLGSSVLFAQTDSIPGPRCGHTIVFVNETFYLFAGEGDSTVRSGPIFNNLARFNADNGIFERVTPLNDPPPARKAHAATEYNGKMYIFQGQGAASLLNDIWKYCPSGNVWTECPSGGASTPPARKNHSATLIGDNIYICGGLDSDGLGLSDFWSYNLATGNWTLKTEHPGPCAGHGAFHHNGLIYVFGGYDPEYSSYRNDIWCYSPDTNTWDYVSAGGTLPSERAFFATAQDTMDSFYIFGGQDTTRTTAMSDNYKFDINTSTWTQLADGPARSKAAAVYFNNTSIYLFGGLDELGNVTDNLWKYDPSTDTWEEIVVGIDEPSNPNTQPLLSQNYPNPFNLTTTIRFSTAVNATNAELVIYNLKGQKVKTLLNETIPAGEHSVLWNGKDEYGNSVRSGLYFYKLIINGNTKAVKKCLLMK